MDPATDEPTAPGRPRLDKRTVTICVVIAAVAAVVAALIVTALLSDDGTSTAGAQSQGLRPAERAPDDTAFTRFDGSPVELSEYRGQKLVVNFFASTCVPCKKEMPALQKVHQRLGDDVTFIGVAVQDDPQAAQELVDKTGVTYDLGQDRTGTLFQRFGAVVLPTTAFVDEHGTVMEVYTGALNEQTITEKVSSNLLAGGYVDGGRYGLALTAGMLATVNPCGLPMLPAYLGYFISDGSDDERSPFTAVMRALVVALSVSLGFLAVFAVAGALVSWVTHDVYEVTPWVTVVVGAILVGVGIFMLCGKQLKLFLPRLDRGGRTTGLVSMFVFGVSYAIASVSCTLPVFLAQVSTTLGTDVGRGILVFAAFAGGMALVLVALSVSLALARTEVVHALRRSLAVIGRVAGGFLVVAGAYLAWYGIYEIRDSVSSDPAIDRVTGWSADLGSVIDGGRAFAIAALLLAAIVAMVAVAYVRSSRPSRSSSSSSP